MEQPILYKPETIQKMRAILEKTCNQGTAHAAVIPGVNVLAKQAQPAYLTKQVTIHH